MAREHARVHPPDPPATKHRHPDHRFGRRFDMISSRAL
jgi:hypothetical protein